MTEGHSYIYAGGMLLRETITSGSTTKTLDFRYDNVGYPYALIYNNGSTTATYYYITNLQGDVMYLVDGNGIQVAAYTYDPYGKILSAYGSMAEINPLRYRGYYYDAETGFYYLQSRYYDPNTCRFINADSYASTGQSYLGYNMFAYCGNNPVEWTDADGEFWDLIFDVVSVVTSVVEVIKNPDDPWAWAGLVGDIVDVAVPFVGGVGEVTKAVGAVSKTADLVDSAHDAVKVADNAVDAAQETKRTLGKIKNAAENLDKGTNSVYVAYHENKTLEYVGITNNFNRRRKEWEGTREAIEICSDLDRTSARYVEQAVIETFGMAKNGGTLSNKINSIARTNKKYVGYLQFFETVAF